MSEAEKAINSYYKGSIGGIAIFGDCYIMGWNCPTNNAVLFFTISLDLNATWANQNFGDQKGLSIKMN